MAAPRFVGTTCLSATANSFLHVNGSSRSVNPMSSTRTVDVPPITNDDVTRRPLA